MANKFLLRMDERGITLQTISSFERIAHQDIANKTEEDKKGFSDFNYSGDILKVDFTHEMENINIDFDFKEAEVSIIGSVIPSQNFERMRKAMTFATKLDRKLYDALEKKGIYLRSASNEDLIRSVCESTKVLGGTMSFKYTGGKNASFKLDGKKGINDVLELYKQCQSR